jgi:poly-gamma-glutamate synthesis protein (capsule biosynthesis protein)
MRHLVFLLVFLFALFSITIQAKASELEIFGAGDTCFAGKLEAIGKSKGYGYFFEALRSEISAADLSILNLETCISLRGQPLPKEFTFRSSPLVLEALKTAGVEAVSLANNHSYDFGEDAFLDTLNYLKKEGIYYAGGGLNEREAFNPALIELESKRIAFFAFTDVLPYGFAAKKDKSGVASAKDKRKVIETIKKWSPKVDLVIISLHWGKELSSLPEKNQIAFAHQLVDSGADIIFGKHPHVVQPVEVYKGKPIFYSLGNFIFSPGNASGTIGVAAKVYTDLLGRPFYIKVLPFIIMSGRPSKAGNLIKNKLLDHLNSMGLRFSPEGDYLVVEICRPASKSFRPFLFFEQKYFKGREFS